MKLTTNLFLVLPDFSQPFELHCDTLKVGIEAKLNLGWEANGLFQ
jgi:hypothetical protein